MVICAGTSLIDCIVTEAGSEAVAEDITLSPGGEAFNEAVWLAALGEEVLFCSAVGQDFAGDALRSVLADKGVTLVSGYSGRTPVSLLTVDRRGERKSKVSRVHELTGWEPMLPEGARPDFVTMASLFRPPFLDPAAALRFAASAKAAGARLLADTKLPKGADPRLADYRETLSLLDFITPNETEAAHYTGCADPVAAAEVFRGYGVKNVVVKLGEKGCYVLPEDGEGFFRPALPVTCVDGIGAGDSFNAGLIHALLRGDTLGEAVACGTRCAARCVTMRGGIAAAAGIRGA